MNITNDTAKWVTYPDEFAQKILDFAFLIKAFTQNVQRQPFQLNGGLQKAPRG